MILMKIHGIDGTSEVDGHHKWIQLEFLAWGLSRPIATETGRTKDRTGTLAQAKDVDVIKKMDSSSARLFELSCGDRGKKVEIHFLSSAGKQVQSYAEWTLEDALISDYSIEGQGMDDAIEKFSLNFTTLEIKSIEKNPGDQTTSPYPVKFSRKTGTTV